MKNQQLMTIDKDLLDEWKEYQVTKLVWRKIKSDFNPYSALWTCNKEDLARYQGQIEIMEVLKTYFGG